MRLARRSGVRPDRRSVRSPRGAAFTPTIGSDEDKARPEDRLLGDLHASGVDIPHGVRSVPTRPKCPRGARLAAELFHNHGYAAATPVSYTAGSESNWPLKLIDNSGERRHSARR